MKFQINSQPKTPLLPPHIDYKGFIVLVICLFLTNLLTYHAVQEQPSFFYSKKNKGLYLINQAKPYVYNLKAFERKVRQVSQKLSIPPEWLMAVMHSESRFDATAANHKGSGATGLIQWMPATAKDFKLTTTKLRNMNHVEQMDYVYAYLNAKRKAHNRAYETLTDLYLAILYPRAIGEDYCYTLYAEPSKAYTMNIGLDKNKDGRVTIQDIDKHLRKLYPTAYHVAQKQPMYAKFLPFIGEGWMK